MTPKILTRLAAVAAVGSIFAATALAQEPSSTEEAVNRAVHVCFACHGERGASTVPIYPKLAGQQRMYTIEQLKLFRAQKRSESDSQAYMWGISALLDDSLINGIADYFAAQPPAKGRPSSGPQATLGQRIYEQGIPGKKVPSCASCHGPNGEGGSVFPRLGGQHSAYVALQLEQFRTRLRPYAVVMAGVTKSMSRDEIQAVANWIEGLGQ